MRILLVDDDVRLSYVITRGLTEEGCAIDMLHDGKERRYLAEISDYDLVILDVMIAKVDGEIAVSATRQSRSSSGRQAIRVAALLRVSALHSRVLLLRKRDMQPGKRDSRWTCPSSEGSSRPSDVLRLRSRKRT